MGNPFSSQDTFCIVLNHERDERLDFLGLFDGHGSNGEHLARFVALNLCDIVLGEHRAQNRDKKDFCQVGWGSLPHLHPILFGKPKL